MKKPIAIAVTNGCSNELYAIDLFTKEDIEKVLEEDHEIAQGGKTIIIYGKDLRSEDHT